MGFEKRQGRGLGTLLSRPQVSAALRYLHANLFWGSLVLCVIGVIWWDGLFFRIGATALVVSLCIYLFRKIVIDRENL